MRDASDCSRLEIIENCHECFIIIMEKAVQFSVAHHAVTTAALQRQPPFLFHRNVNVLINAFN